MTVAGIVLAAGRSSRMGVPKALLDFRGAPFVVRVLEAFEALDLRHRVVVLGPDADRIRAVLAQHDCLIVENRDPASGQIGSLRLALQALDTSRPAAALVWPVDLPHVQLATVEQLLETYRRKPAPVTLPSFGGRRGHPVIWDQSLFEELGNSARAEQEGARAVLHAHLSEAAVVAVADAAVIDFVNTPEDYERLVRRINQA